MLKKRIIYLVVFVSIMCNIVLLVIVVRNTNNNEEIKITKDKQITSSEQIVGNEDIKQDSKYEIDLQNETNNVNQEDGDNTDEEKDVVGENKETIEYEDQIYERVGEAKGNKVIYYSENRTILIKSEGGYNKINQVENNGFASLPQLSPNKENIAYISPYEFELNGEIYIHNLENNKNEKLIQVNKDKDEAAKVVKWLDDERLLIIIGCGTGTVNIGGDFYTYNIKNKELKLIMDVEGSKQITDVNIIEKKVVLDVITWDENFTEYTTEQVTVNVE